MNTIVDIGTLVLSIALVALIALQQRGGGGGIGSSVFGGGGGGNTPFMQRRGIEKYTYYITWAVAVALIAISILRVWF
ncbi:MAG: preprotein translocase subunit SecG [Patescibacteria group bacterium]|mgnify:CR=1 FL=1